MQSKLMPYLPLRAYYTIKSFSNFSITMFLMRSLHFILLRVVFVEDKLTKVGWYSKAIRNGETGDPCKN